MTKHVKCLMLSLIAKERMWIDYDKVADVLYKKPQKATDAEMLKSGILIRYRGDEVVGLTILEASQRKG
ncbi:MAG: DUF2283 domain-containing protein [bacterium]